MFFFTYYLVLFLFVFCLLYRIYAGGKTNKNTNHLLVNDITNTYDLRAFEKIFGNCMRLRPRNEPNRL